MHAIKRILLWPVFILILRPLIKRNYRLRTEGKLPDEWYWADTLAVNYGFFVGRTLGFIEIPYIRRLITHKIRYTLFRIKLKLRIWGLI